jgi:excinuclease UvrABC nuclease subunit
VLKDFEVFAVSYEETGSELVALLKESEEIKKNKPKYNEHSKSIFNGHYILDGRLFELKIIKSGRT